MRDASASNKLAAKTRLVALVVLLCFIAITLFAEAFIITHADHNCHGDACSTCIQILNAESLLEQFGKVAGFLLIVGISLFIAIIVPFLPDLPEVYTTSLVSKKVRMDN